MICSIKQRNAFHLKSLLVSKSTIWPYFQHKYDNDIGTGLMFKLLEVRYRAHVAVIGNPAAL